MTEPEPMPDAEVPKWLRDDEREVVRAECVRYRPRNTTDDERHPYLDWCEVLCRRMAEARKELAEVPKRGASIAGLSKRFQDAYREHWDIQSCHCVQCDALRELAESKRREQDANEHAADFGADVQRLERERDAEVEKREAAEDCLRIMTGHRDTLLREKQQRRAERDALQEEVDAFKCASMLVGHSGDPANITPGAVEKHITELRAAEAERDTLKTDYIGCVKKFDDCRAQLARCVDHCGEDRDGYGQADEDGRPWHEWLIEEAEKRIRALRAERDALEARLDEIAEQQRIIMAEPCDASQRHCTCVPVLRREVERLRAALETLKTGTRTQGRSSGNYKAWVRETAEAALHPEPEGKPSSSAKATEDEQ